MPARQRLLQAELPARLAYRVWRKLLTALRLDLGGREWLVLLR